MASTHSVLTRHSRPEVASPVLGYVFIAAATLCWGIAAVLGRAVFTGRLLSEAVRPIDPLILAQSRTTISLIVLAPVLLFLGGTAALRMSRRDIALCMTLGVLGMAGSNYFYYLAIQRTNVATAIILQYTAPVFVLLYMIARKRQRASVRRVASVALAVMGAALAIGIGSGRFQLDTLGVMAAMAAAFAFSYYNISGSELVQRNDRWSVLVWAFAGAAVFWMLVNPPWKVVAGHYTGGQWAFMAIFAIASVLLPFSLYFSGLQFLDATRAIITSCLEPVFSIVIAAAVLGEVVGPTQVLGIAVVLVAIILVQMPERSAARDTAIAVEPIE